MDCRLILCVLCEATLVAFLNRSACVINYCLLWCDFARLVDSLRMCKCGKLKLWDCGLCWLVPPAEKIQIQMRAPLVQEVFF